MSRRNRPRPRPRPYRSRRSRRSPTPLLGAGVVVLAAAAVYMTSGAGRDGELVVTAEGSQVYESANAPLIRPTDEHYRRYAPDDSAWRAAQQRLFAETRRTVVSSAGMWRPTPRLEMQDRVVELKNAGEIDEAITVLETWVAQNPRDRQTLLSLARLLNQAGREDEATARYRQFLGESE